MTITGTLFADVNHYHPLLDAKAYAATGAPCIGVKIGQGSTKDSTADASVAEAEAEGLIVIGYIFGTNRPGADQAEQLVDWFPWKPGRIWCIDDEANGPNPSDSITSAQASAAIARLRELLPKSPKGLLPCHYHNVTRPALPGTLQWIARYGVTTPPSGAHAWQYYGGVVGEEPHHLAGVSGSVCDMNKLLVSTDQLRTWAGLVGGGEVDDGEEGDVSAKDVRDAFGLGKDALEGAGQVLAGVWDYLRGRDVMADPIADDVREGAYNLAKKLDQA